MWRVRHGHGPGRRFDHERLHDRDVVKTHESQQRMRALPIHNGRPLHAADAAEPVRVHGVNRERVQPGPDGGGDIIQHDQIEVRLRLGHVRCDGQFHFAGGFERFLQQAIAARRQQHFHRLRQDAHNGGLVVRGQVVLGGNPDAENAVPRLRGQENDRRGVCRWNRD